MTFVHIHRHSDWSFLDGCGTNAQFAKRAAELGQPALALTDHGNMCGALYHIEACREHGIKPISGMESYFVWDHEEENSSYAHLVLLAMNEVGWKNLLALTSASFDPIRTVKRKPCVDWNLLVEHSEGIIATSSCANGPVSGPTLLGDDCGVTDGLLAFKSLYGDRFYVEIQPHDFDEQRKLNTRLVLKARELGIPIVAAVDAHYPEKDWHDTHDLLLMMNTRQTVKTRQKALEEGDDYFAFSGRSFWLMSREEVEQTFAEHHKSLPKAVVREAMDETLNLADRVEEFEISKEPKIPRATRSPLEAERIVRNWCNEGLERISKKSDPEYRDRLETELRVIRSKGVMDYFVIVGKGVRHAKDRGIRVGPCRGSAGGSLVAYLSRITALDPIGYDLLFERFLNEYRSELPDIDLDFQHDRREEVKEFYRKEFGQGHVVDVAAFQTFGLRGAIQAVARVMCMDYGETMSVTKTIDDHPARPAGLERFDDPGPVGEWGEKYPEARTHVKRLLGQARGISKHPAAVIITDRPAHEYIPLMRANDGSTMSQWSERADFQIISSYGFLKIDLLSTDALTHQHDVIKMINERHGIEIDFEDPKQFPVMTSPELSDPKVVERFGTGKTELGIFQFHSAGMVRMLKEIEPTRLDDLIAANTLYRPGTLEGDTVSRFIARKHGKEPVTYWHPDVKPFMERSYGLMIYQEQVMQVGQVLGGFDKAESNMLLKALTKWHGSRGNKQKGAVKIATFEERFVSGCLSKGISESMAKEAWAEIVNLTKYVFNRSHSAGYALQAYQDMVLKVWLPEFYASLLTREPDKVAGTIREAKGRGVKILPPDVNVSEAGFTLDGDAIRFGLAAVKNVGLTAVQEIVAKRPFKNEEDMLERVEKRRVNSRVYKSLVQCGAVDRWGARDGWERSEKLLYEKELLGFPLSGQDSHALILKNLVARTIDGALEDESKHTLGGEIVEVKQIKTRKGAEMARARVELPSGDEFGAVFFPGVFQNGARDEIYEGNVILVAGTWKAGKEELLVDTICSADQLYKEVGA